jgi:NAD(P)-dependent dehydrogenase (short-subunit alcohol dehydrogenase family)
MDLSILVLVEAELKTMKIHNQIALITGGASGMGAATAKFLAKRGAKVALLDANLQAAQEVAQSIKGLAVACDVVSAESAEAAIEQVKQNMGIPRICINCAGIAPAKRIVGRQGPMPLADFAQVINVNLIGTFNMMRLAAAAMMQLEPLTEESNERGVIINTASIAAYEGQVGQTAYSASKGGVVALTLPAARELAQFSIRVMTIAPGLIETPLLLNMSDEVREGLIKHVPYPKRFGFPQEFAELALHIIENPMLNGSVIRLDAALRMPE